MCIHIKRMNRAVLALKDDHPAKRFLTAFIECRRNCAGRELDVGGREPVDQTWTSATDGRVWTFSGFVYSFICFDIELDGFLRQAPELTASEIAAMQGLPRVRAMMDECAEAARTEGNAEILEFVQQVVAMFGFWEEYLTFRQAMVGSPGTELEFAL